MSYLRPSSGFHSSLCTCLPLPPLPPPCSLHALYTLPPHVFVDPNELTRDHDLRSAVDLEAPAFNVDQRPTHILYNITSDTARFYPNGTVCFNLPIHARYGTPSKSHLYHVSIDCPQVFSSCPRSSGSQVTPEAGEFSGFLPAGGVTPHPFQEPASCPVSLHLPVGDPCALKDVQLGTALVLLSATIYCLSAFVKTFLRLRTQTTVDKED